MQRLIEDIAEQRRVPAPELLLLQNEAARQESEKTIRNLSYLADATKVLSSSLNYNDTLQQFAKIVVSHLSDWCSIDIMNNQGMLENVVIYHRNAQKVRWLKKLLEKYPRDQSGKSGASRVVKTGEAILLPEISSLISPEDPSDQEYHGRLVELGMASAMIAPLKAFDNVFGTITLVSAESKRRYNEYDLSIAQDLAQRASLAIENARLYERAQEANRAKSAFLANMSHEIRTPLGAMIGFADLVIDSKNLNPDEKSYVEIIRRNGCQLLKIVDEILDISKVESEQINIEHIRFSLCDVIDDVSGLLRFQAKDKGLQFSVQMSPRVPQWLISDPTRLRQILINVIGNAIKFTEKGSVHVSIDALPAEKESKVTRLSIVVKDTGLGISTRHQKNLFQAFAQGDSSTARKFGGTGLGLILSKKLAQVLGGDLVLRESELGYGSTFEITVESALAQDNDKDSELKKDFEAGNSMPGTAPEPQAPRVLIVDDSPDNREMVGLFIKRLGCEVGFACDGAEGVNEALSGSYDLVLMDVQMPVVDGFEAVARLRQAHYPRPIVALTAHAMKGDREKCLENGFDNYLVKPVSRKSLQALLVEYGLTCQSSIS